jgi:hypothetical protein
LEHTQAQTDGRSAYEGHHARDRAPARTLRVHDLEGVDGLLDELHRAVELRSCLRLALADLPHEHLLRLRVRARARARARVRVGVRVRSRVKVRVRVRGWG